MANIKNFGIAGVSADVQMGKSGGRVVYDSGNTLFKFTTSDGSTLAKLRVADPTGSTDVVTKGYLDGISAGLDIKESVRVASTANGALATAWANGEAVDGITLATNDRILLKDQTTGAENGIYTVNASGAPTRGTDADATTGELDGGSFFFVEEGSTNADSGWVLTNDGTVTIGTTALTFTQFSGAGMITAGAGLTKSGNTFNAIAGTGITVNANDIQISATYAGQNTITTLGTVGTGTWQGTAIANAYVAQDLTIVAGTVDNSVIGGSTAAAGSFTTLSASGAITGTLGTAAQTNVTSLGTLTALTVDNINVNGNAITSTDTNGNIAITPHGSGEVDISKVDIDSGAIDGTAIGANSASTGAFTTVNTTGAATLASVDINGGSIDGTNIGAAAVGTAAFSTISATGAISVDTISEKSSAAGVTIDGVQLKDSVVVVDTINEKTGAAGVTIDGVLIKDNTVKGNVTIEGGETLDVSAGTMTFAADQISGNSIEGGTIGSITISSLTASAGTFTGNVNPSGGTLTLANNQISGDALHGGTFSSFTSTGITDGGAGTAITIDGSNNVTTSGNLTVGGDLTISGSNNTINTATLTVEDPLSLLSSGASGSASVDAGFIVERGDDTNVGWLWDESVNTFAFVETADTATTAGNVTISDYANVHAGTLELDDNLTFNGSPVVTFTGAADFRMKDNDAAAFDINQGGTSYLTFVTTNGSEKITLAKKLEAGAVEIEGSNFDINGGAIDGAIIGANSAAAGTFTTVNASGAITGDLTGNADTATTLANARTIGGVSFNGGANIVPGTITVADTTDTTSFVGLWESATGDLAPKTDAGLTYNAGTASLAATTFVGALTGAVTGNADSATLATSVTVTANNSTDETIFLTFVDGASGTQGLETDAGLTYNPSTGLLTTATLTTTGAATLATAKVSSLTDNRVVLGGTAGLLEDSANFTFDGSTMQITGAANVTGDLDVDNLNLNGNAITSTDTNGNIDLTPHGSGEVNITKVDIAGGAIDGTIIGAASAAAGTFTTVTGTVATATQNSVTTMTSLASVGTITSGVWSGTALVDAKVANDLTISGGTVNASVIGASTPAAATVTTFTSTGIDDNAAGNALTLDGSNHVVVTNNLSVGGNATVTGNLTVNGTTTSISTTNTQIEDNMLLLNEGESGASITETFSGITVDRGSSANAHFAYDDGQDRWEALSGNDTIASASLSAIAFGTVGAGTWQGTAVAGAYGGTGISTAGTTGVARLDSGTWSVGDASLTADVSGTLPVANGGTAATSLDDITSANNLLTVGAGADTIIGGDVTLTVNQANMALSSIGGSLALGSQVSGQLPVANGGTGIASGTAGKFLKFTGSTTIASAYAGDLYANDVKVFTVSGATTSGSGEGLAMTNAAGRANLRSVNTAASGDVDLYLGAQGSGDVIIEGTGNGIVKGDNDLDLTVRGGDASAADAGDLIISGGNGTGSHDSGNVYIQGGLGGASNGEVQIRDASGNEIIAFNETGSAVNYIQITNQATGSAPQIDAVGDDTNVSLYLNPKGTGVVNVPASYKDRAGFGTNSLVTKEYVDANSSTETFARRASFTANSSLTNVNIGAVLKTGTTNYVNKVVVSVTTALSGGSIAGLRLHDGTAYLTALADCDTTSVGTYVIDLPTTTSTASAAQLNVKMVQSNGTTAATPTAGVVVTTVQYVQV